MKSLPSLPPKLLNTVTRSKKGYMGRWIDQLPGGNSVGSKTQETALTGFGAPEKDYSTALARDQFRSSWL